jgi:hypothetical protein
LFTSAADRRGRGGDLAACRSNLGRRSRRGSPIKVNKGFKLPVAV